MLNNPTNGRRAVSVDHGEAVEGIVADHGDVVRVKLESDHQYVSRLQELARHDLINRTFPDRFSESQTAGLHQAVAMRLTPVALHVGQHSADVAERAPGQSCAVEAAAITAAVLERDAQVGASRFDDLAHSTPELIAMPGTSTVFPSCGFIFGSPR